MRRGSKPYTLEAAAVVMMPPASAFDADISRLRYFRFFYYFRQPFTSEVFSFLRRHAALRFPLRCLRYATAFYHFFLMMPSPSSLPDRCRS